MNVCKALAHSRCSRNSSQFKPVALSSLEDFSKEEALWAARTGQRWKVNQAWLSLFFPAPRWHLPPQEAMTEARKLPPPLPPRLDWFVQTQMDQLAQGGVPSWFHGAISRQWGPTHTFHPALCHLSLSAPTLGRFSLWISGLNLAKRVKRVKGALESELESHIHCELAVCSWATHFPSLDLSFLYTSSHQTSTASDLAGPHIHPQPGQASPINDSRIQPQNPS